MGCCWHSHELSKIFLQRLAKPLNSSVGNSLRGPAWGTSCKKPSCFHRGFREGGVIVTFVCQWKNGLLKNAVAGLAAVALAPVAGATDEKQRAAAFGPARDVAALFDS